MAGEKGVEVEPSGLVNTLQGHVDDIRSQLQCGICIRLLYEPFTLACGHTFCYSCLSSWFAGGKSKRTCPDCRAPVKAQPAPAYLVRTVVQIFTTRAELLDKGETTAEHLTHRQEESGKLDQDKSNTDPQHGGLFGGLFNPKPPPLQPVVDLDDGVMRCPVCNWELADEEVCAGCGYEYHGDSDGTDYSDESDELSGTDNYDSIIDDEADDDGFGDIEDDDEVWGTYGLPGMGAPDSIPYPAVFSPFYEPGMQWPPRQWSRPSRPNGSGVILTDPSEYDDHFDDEENEYDEADSFIDDDEHMNHEDDDSQSEPSTVVDSGRGWQPGSYRRRIPPISILSDDDEDEDEVGEGVREDHYDDDDDDDEEDEDEDSVVGRPHRRQFPTFASDEEEDEDGETDDEENPGGHYFHDAVENHQTEESDSSELSSPPPRRPTRPARGPGVTFGNAITIDDSEDEQPVGPVRRTAQRRHARFSPY